MRETDRRTVLKGIAGAGGALGFGSLPGVGAGGASAAGSDRLEVAIFQTEFVTEHHGRGIQSLVADQARRLLELSGFEPATGGGVGAGGVTLSGTVEGGDDAVHGHDPAVDRGELTVTLSGPDDADLDLYVTLDGRRPTTEDYDVRSWTYGSEETVTVDAADVTDLGIMVDAYYGGGAYEVTIEASAGLPAYVPEHLVADATRGEYVVREPDETHDALSDDFNEWGGRDEDGDYHHPDDIHHDEGWDRYHGFLADADGTAKDANLLLVGGPGGSAFGNSAVKSVDSRFWHMGSQYGYWSPLDDFDGPKLARKAFFRNEYASGNRIKNDGAVQLWAIMHELSHMLTGGIRDHQSGHQWLHDGDKYVSIMGNRTMGDGDTNTCGREVDTPDWSGWDDLKYLYYGLSDCMQGAFRVSDSMPDWESKVE